MDEIPGLRLGLCMMPAVDMCFFRIILIGVAKSWVPWLQLLFALPGGLWFAYHGASLCVHCCFYYLMRCNMWIVRVDFGLWWNKLDSIVPMTNYAMHALVSLLLVRLLWYQCYIICATACCCIATGPLSKPNGAKFWIQVLRDNREMPRVCTQIIICYCDGSRVLWN